MRQTTARIFLLISVVGILLSMTGSTYAAKPRIRSTTAASSGKSAGIGYSSAKLSRGTNSVILTLLNLSAVSRIDYILSYTANGIPQGVVGSVTPSGANSDSRDLYFGTCSKGVCTPHLNITNASLTVTTKLKSGGTYTKRYRIKI